MLCISILVYQLISFKNLKIMTLRHGMSDEYQQHLRSH
jgi:hypothetical protein